MEDKRIINSKARIRTGLLECLKDSGLEGVSIKSVCDKIGINRCTFYAHFSSLQEVYFQIEDEFLSGLNASFAKYHDQQIDIGQLVHECFVYFYERKEAFHTLLKTNFSSLVSHRLTTINQDLHEDQVYLDPFCLAGTFMVLYRWLEQGEKETPEEIETILLGILLRTDLHLQKETEEN